MQIALALMMPTWIQHDFWQPVKLAMKQKVLFRNRRYIFKLQNCLKGRMEINILSEMKKKSFASHLLIMILCKPKNNNNFSSERKEIISLYVM